MAPPGAGGSSGALDAVYDNPYSPSDSRDYNAYRVMPIFTGSERISMRVLLAFACILILGALAAFAMIVLRSWLKDNGKRNKSRLSVFVILLVFVIAGRSVRVVDIVNTLQAPNRLGSIYEYDNLEFLLGHVFSLLFSWLSDLLIFTLILFEITRNIVDNKMKRSLFEIVNGGVIFLLFVLAITKWAMDTRWTMAGWMEDYWRIPESVLRSALAGIQTTYAAIALLFAIEIFVVVKRKSYPKKHGMLLILLATALLWGQVLDLVKTTIYWFGTSNNASITFLGVSSVVEAIWVAKLLLLALLARNSYAYIRTGAPARIGSDQVDKV